MNEELQIALSELINKSMELGGNALAFTKEQLPEVVQQLLVWKAFYSGFLCVASIMAGYIFYRAHVFGVKIIEERVTERDADIRLFYLLAILTVPLSVGISGELFSLTWLQIWLAPKVYLLEYAAQLTR